MINTKQMLAQAIASGASDVHINADMPPIMRINTELIMMDLPFFFHVVLFPMIVKMMAG